jgi:hypothetical protein
MLSNKSIKQREFKYLGQLISDYRRDWEIKLPSYNKIRGIKRNLGKQMPSDVKIRKHQVTATVALKYGSDDGWVLKERCTK